MKRPLLLLSLALLSMPSSAADAPKVSTAAADPLLWLEEVEGGKALEWVEARNKTSLAELQGDPRWAQIESEVRKITVAEDRIPEPALRDGWIYNFWQDSMHVRGIWRRAKPKEYAKPEPKWELVLDIDKLAADEGENWVFQGSNCMPGGSERCLLSFSRGGKDAAVMREFDVRKKAFVKDGFILPEAKSDASWVDKDTLLMGTDFGPGTLTDSGYPRLVHRWKRGTRPDEAKRVFECEVSDVGCWSASYFRSEGNNVFVVRSKTFFSGEQYLVGKDGSLTPNPMPEDADFQGVFAGKVLGLLRTDWATGSAAFPAGALVSLPLGKLAAPDYASSVEVVYKPDARSSLQYVAISKNRLFLSVLENVIGKVVAASPSSSGWKLEAVPFPDNGKADVIATDPFDSLVMARYENMLVPDTVYSFRDKKPGKTMASLKALPRRFDATGFVVKQYEAASADGTMIPYFLVHKEGLPMDGSGPTLLYGYGGFEYSQTPQYLETFGKLWLEKGGVYVLANIRGGGEFGPKWHMAALKTNRQKAFDDFLAVADDLVRRKVTSPRRLGIMGGSNGGLLVGAAFTQRPELFRAVVCQVPLADMLRYHKLLAGASWMGEYGNPEDPVEGAAIRKYSPYQNLKPGRTYPRVFFITSTKDDRVHPAHARKMVARMEELGYPVLYFENTEGGHSAAANLEQRVKKRSLEFSYLYRMLLD